MTELREYVEESIPDFLDVEITEHIEDDGDDGERIVRVTGKSNGTTYSSEVTQQNLDNAPDEMIQMFIERMLASLVGNASKDEFEDSFPELSE